MQFEDLLASITPETFERLVAAVETGRWPDGVALTEAQKENTIQLVMAYQAKYCPSDEPFRVGADGLLVTRSKREMKASFNPNEQTIASFSLHNEES
ncbi:YeaC family protein [Pseudidiomarina sp.]|uniref:YeaC family protein n=1 Tax=Pseudidiomarina sp. TaxID=2081707 RepID=UPI003A981035